MFKTVYNVLGQKVQRYSGPWSKRSDISEKSHGTIGAKNVLECSRIFQFGPYGPGPVCWTDALTP